MGMIYVKKINVLFLFAEPFSYGGQEAFAINMYNKIDKRKFNIDFYTPFGCDNKDIKNILAKNGDKIFFDNYEFETKKRKRYFLKGVKNLIKNNSYDIIHVNSGSTFSLAMAARIIKNNTNSKVIVHSHATGISSLRHKITNAYLKRYFKYADFFIACSDDAGKFRFSSKITERKNYIIIKNGIDIDRFKYNSEIREEYRKKLGIYKNDFVIGNIGRCSTEKNHSFLIDIFKEIHDYHKNVKLLFVGDGPIKNDIIKKLNDYDLLDSTILLEKRNDVNNLLQVLDIFMFPSIFEGLGIAAIESQISGLTTLCSSEVPKQAKVIDRCYFLSLDEKNNWINKIEEEMRIKSNRNYSQLNVVNDGFDSSSCAKILEGIYLEVLNENQNKVSK